MRAVRQRAGRSAWLGAACAATLAIAGCGSSGSSGSGHSTGASGSPAAAHGSSGGDILIGNIGSYTGPEASSIAPGEKVLNAWASALNSAGGINGRHVRLIAMDDGASPPTGLQDAKKLLQDKVVAIVGVSSLTAPVWAPVVDAAHVPVIGGYPSFPPFGSDANFFPSGSSVVPQLYGTMVIGKAHGTSWGDLYCTESPICAQAAHSYKLMAPALGVKTFATSVSASQPSYTAPCQALKDSGAQAYQVNEAAAVALKIIDACRAQGVTATPVASGGIANSTWLTSPAVQGMVNEESDFPFFVSSTPATKAYQALLTKYRLGNGGDGSGTYAYAGAKLFQTAAQSLGHSAVTSSALRAALYSFKNQTLGGLTPPLTFTSGQATQVDCWYEDKIENHKWALGPNGLKPSCAPSSSVAVGDKAYAK